MQNTAWSLRLAAEAPALHLNRLANNTAQFLGIRLQRDRLRTFCVSCFAVLSLGLFTNGSHRVNASPLPTAQVIPLPTFSVDHDLHPALSSLPKSPDRHLAAIADAHTNKADFVENEIILFAVSERVARDFAARWRGSVISTIDFSQTVFRRIPRSYLVRVDSSLATTSTLSKDLRFADKLSRGTHRISSEAGLRTLAVAARANATGTKAGLNFVLQFDSIPHWSTTESPHGPVNYGPEAFQWPYMCQLLPGLNDANCIQNIGVGAAWRALQAAGKLSNKVKIVIWDSGFDPNFVDSVGNTFAPCDGAVGTIPVRPGTSRTNCDFPGQTNIVPANSAGVPGQARVGRLAVTYPAPSTARMWHWPGWPLQTMTLAQPGLVVQSQI
jgi:hypothetical protein